MKLLSIVLNRLDNDSRVLKIGKTLAAEHNLTYAAISLKYSREPFYVEKNCHFRTIRITFSSSRKSFSRKTVIIKKYREKNPFFTQLLNIQRKLRWDVFTIQRLYKALISEHFDIYYCNDFNTLIAGYFASRKKRAKLVYDSHELWSERNGSRRNLYARIKRLPELFIEGFISRRCDLVITVSDGIANEMMKRLSIKKPLIIRNLDEKKYLPNDNKRSLMRKHLGIPEESIVLIYQGSLHPNRGIGDLICAMDDLPANIHLILMGSFLSEEMLKNFQDKERIHYLGLKPVGEIHLISSCADIGIAPILTKGFMSHYLTFPNKFSQYMNAGLALALYKCPEAEHIINKYKCGITFNPGYPEEIVSAVNYIINSGKLDIMKENARKGFLDEYSWSNIEKSLLSHFREL